MLSATTGLVFLVIGYVVLGVTLFALLDAALRREDAFRAAGKQQKAFWLIILTVAVAWEALLGWFSIVGALGVVAAIVYIVDARPAIRAVSRGRKRDNRKMGPYGPW
jgi:hypothetical protein